MDARTPEETFHYRYATGREGDASLVGLASRKQYIVAWGEGERRRRSNRSDGG